MADTTDSDEPADGHRARSTALTLSEKLDALFRAVRPATGKEYSSEQVATSIREAGGPTISATYVWLLRRGERDNPTMHHLEALAGFFGVPPSYFFDDDRTADVQEQLALLALLRDLDVRRVALRASGLSRESLAAVAETVARLRALEGLPMERELPGAAQQG